MFAIALSLDLSLSHCVCISISLFLSFSFNHIHTHTHIHTYTHIQGKQPAWEGLPAYVLSKQAPFDESGRTFGLGEPPKQHQPDPSKVRRSDAPPVEDPVPPTRPCPRAATKVVPLVKVWTRLFTNMGVPSVPASVPQVHKKSSMDASRTTFHNPHALKPRKIDVRSGT